MLRSDDHGRVRVLTLDRPKASNAFNAALYTGLAEALATARDDDNVHAVVVTGAGGVFSTGQDLRELAGLGERARDGALGGDGDVSGFSALLDAVTAFDKPLLAAVNGPGIGIGFTLLAHCDLVLVAPTARFRAPFAPMGVAPEAASSLLLPAIMGPQRAAELLFTGDWLSAEEAVRTGLALRVYDDVLADTLALAARIAEHPLASLRAIKRTMLAARADAVSRALATEADEFATLLEGYGAG